MQRVDVAVVGGGPAGSSAGRAAAAEGADALVIEKGVPRADREGLGPDSTDAAGILDYWVDIMDLDVPIPEHVKLRELTGADFIGPNASVELDETGIDASYPNFGFTFQRARMDDWLRERAEDAGAEYRVGTGVREVESDLTGAPTHQLTLKDGTEIEADYLVLADGPQRTVTGQVLEPLLPDGQFDGLASTTANHIAYQEYREIPEELLETDRLKFWWGHMPGHTAYPWVFPNDGQVARVGLTMPIGLDLDTVENREDYALLRPEDERVPAGKEYISRLLEYAYPEYDAEDFPLLEDRGKAKGTETYPISSTRPIESPTKANVAVVGGAMGATSAFHEGGDHVAIRSGKEAGRLAGLGALRAYNYEWKRAIGEEVRRNVVLADMVRDYGPSDWDRVFGLASAMQPDEGGRTDWLDAIRAGPGALKLFAQYQYGKFQNRDGGYCQIREDDYSV
ncbi:NAD(P)/FAD-dependent oxidoreductase [Haloglomus litoreum]|uniref:NAD(P)/FAD-dependent oxidoreductase n=1 Tax=Haloglomus litoreum TaxID=3034026 RepID=UPI0023E857A4|nr:NAD(P)/FAD-dependent oxidoreductase [Haloglomus sp. DT116]